MIRDAIIHLRCHRYYIILYYYSDDTIKITYYFNNNGRVTKRKLTWWGGVSLISWKNRNGDNDNTLYHRITSHHTVDGIVITRDTRRERFRVKKKKKETPSSRNIFFFLNFSLFTLSAHNERLRRVRLPRENQSYTRQTHVKQF